MLKNRKDIGRIIAGSLCAGMISAALVGCGGKPTTSGTNTQTGSSNEKPVTISISNYPKETDTAERAKWDGWLKAMKEKYPYITVKPDEYQYDVNTFFPKAASGQLTTMYLSWFTEINKIVSAGYAADVTSVMSKYGYDKAINADLLKLVQKDGKYYGLPRDAYSMGLLYNVKLWKDAGLVDDKGVPKFPKTYDELAQDAKTIKDKTGKAGFFFPAKNNQGGWQFMNVAWSFGAEFEKNENGKWKAVFNSPEAVAALQYIKDLKWKYDCLQSNVLTDMSEMQKLVGTDQCATAFGGLNQALITDYNMSKDNEALSSVPAGPKAKYSLTGGNSYFFSNTATADQIDAAFKFLQVSGFSPNYSDEDVKAFDANQKALADKKEIAGLHEMRIWTDPKRMAMEDEIYKKYLNVNINLFQDFLDNGAKNLKPEEPVNCQELYKTLDSVIQAVLTDKNADPKAVLDKAVASFQKDYLDKAN